MAFGQSTQRRYGGGTPASADGAPEYKVGGVTIDWTTAVAANVAAVTLDDASIVPANQKYLPYGTILARITASGLYGPYDPSAVDGRGDLARGACFVLNYTVYGGGGPQDDLHADNPPGVFDGGRVYLDRLKCIDAAAYIGTEAIVWSADVQAAFPRLTPVDVDL